jgi:hypothetical protein
VGLTRCQLREEHGSQVMGKFESAKSLRDQVVEIEKIISDAQQHLKQADYALQTLEKRLEALELTQRS